MIERTSYKGWNALAVNCGSTQIMITPEIGGRIMGVLYDGHDICFTQPEREGSLPSIEQQKNLENWRRDLGFPLWGGGKTWLAPEEDFPQGFPHPDLDSGPFLISNLKNLEGRASVELCSRPCRDTGITVRRTIATDEQHPNSWRTQHELINNGNKAWTGGIWDVLMLRRPAKAVLPCDQGWSGSPYDQGLRIFEEKADSKRSLSFVKRNAEDGTVAITCESSHEYKLGIGLRDGWSAVVMPHGPHATQGQERELHYLRRFQHYSPGTAFAHGHQGEVYNSGLYDYMEIETHGPLVTLEPGQSTSFSLLESLTLQPKDTAVETLTGKEMS